PTVHEERDLPLLDLEVLRAHVVDVLAARDEPALLDREVGDDPHAACFLCGFDQQGLLAGKWVPDGVACRGHGSDQLAPAIRSQSPRWRNWWREGGWGAWVSSQRTGVSERFVSACMPSTLDQQ